MQLHSVGLNRGVPKAATASRAGQMEPPPTIRFWYDISSFNAYRGSTKIEALAARAGAKLVYEPFLIGGLFKALCPNINYGALGWPCHQLPPDSTRKLLFQPAVAFPLPPPPFRPVDNLTQCCGPLAGQR